MVSWNLRSVPRPPWPVCSSFQELTEWQLMQPWPNLPSCGSAWHSKQLVCATGLKRWNTSDSGLGNELA